MLAQTEIDRNTIAAADLRADADLGRELMKAMDAKHYEQGFMAAQIGMAADNAGLYSHAHLAGYAAAKAGATPHYVSVGGLPALARVLAAVAILIVLLSAAPSAHAAPPPPAVYLPMVQNGAGWIDMPLAAETQQHPYYVPYAPYMHRPTRFFGLIYGTATCRADGTPASRAVIYFDYVQGGGTSGTANQAGEYIISTAPIGTRGYLTWNGHTLTGIVEVSVTPQRIDVRLDCTVSGDGI